MTAERGWPSGCQHSMAVAAIGTIALAAALAWAAGAAAQERHLPAARSAPADAPVSDTAPFQQSPQEQQFVDELLSAWEGRSKQIKKLECQFRRWEFNPGFGPVNRGGTLLATAISVGDIKYIKPDKGLFRVTETQFWNAAAGKFQTAAEETGEHYVCDGAFIYELDGQKKQVIRTQVPRELQGRQIADGPFPFLLFGADAAELKQRYWIRERTDERYAAEEIWLEAYPRRRDDAAQYKFLQLIMKRKDFLPYALRMFAPNGKDYIVYEFTGVKINNILSKNSISAPDVPRGWQQVERQ